MGSGGARDERPPTASAAAAAAAAALGRPLLVLRPASGAQARGAPLDDQWELCSGRAAGSAAAPNWLQGVLRHRGQTLAEAAKAESAKAEAPTEAEAEAEAEEATTTTITTRQLQPRVQHEGDKIENLARRQLVAPFRVGAAWARSWPSVQSGCASCRPSMAADCHREWLSVGLGTSSSWVQGQAKSRAKAEPKWCQSNSDAGQACVACVPSGATSEPAM